MEKKYLKITQKGFEHYNGPLSVYEFVDGVSVEPIPDFERDRIAATMSCIEVAENGKESIAGIAERLVKDSAARAPQAERFERQSVDDKVSEERRLAELALGDTKTIYTEAELDALISQGGIAALRGVASSWNVKNRSIPTLRQMILDAQDQYIVKHGKKVEANKAAVEKIVRDTEDANRVEEPLDDEPLNEGAAPNHPDEETLNAAMTGDMSAALNEEQNDPVDDEPVVEPEQKVE